MVSLFGQVTYPFSTYFRCGFDVVGIGGCVEDIRLATVDVMGQTAGFAAVTPIGIVCPGCNAGSGFGCADLPQGEYHDEAIVAAGRATVSLGQSIKTTLETSDCVAEDFVVRWWGEQG